MTSTTMLGAGIGQPWLDWRRKVDLLPNGVAVLDRLDRTDWPGDDVQWDRFVQLQRWAQRLCGDDNGAGWSEPPETIPERIPAGMWRGLNRLDETPPVSRVAQWVSDFHTDHKMRRGLLLVGPVGTGKTAIAASLAHDTDPYCFWPTSDLVQHLMDGYGTNSFGYRFAALAGRGLLIIDDLGSERDTDGQTDLVVKLLDARHRKSVHTVITTNLRSDFRIQRYGQRIESRLIDMCEEVPVVGSDRRAA